MDSVSGRLSVGDESIFVDDGSSVWRKEAPEASRSCLLASVRRRKLRRASFARIDVV